MSAGCPRPCGRLVTAAIFVSVGVVQFIVGLILLRSKYVYLLSAPNFWTAVSNLAVGCVLGVSASVWKNTSKSSPKHTARRNVLAALVVSAIFMNSATAVILILGEGNTLLSIRLESDGKYSFASEILAYSYATSVCSPVVCVVVAVTYLSGIWFRRSDKGEKTSEIKSILKKDSMNDYNWVFKEKHDLLKKDPRMVKALSFKSLSSCSDDESPYSRFRPRSGRLQEYSDASLRRDVEKTPNDRRVLQNSAYECGEHANESVRENTLHEPIRYSLLDEGSAKRIKPQNNSPFIYRKHSRHFNANDQFHPNECRSRNESNSLIYEESNSNNQYFEDLKMQSRRKRMLFKAHSPFQRDEIFESNENKENMQNYHAFQDEARNKLNFSVNSCDVEADVHMDSSSLNDPELSIYESHELSPNETILIYEGNISSSNSRENTKKIHDSDASIQLTSSHRRLSHPDISYMDENKHDVGFPKVHRTSTTENMSTSRISQFDVSDIEVDSDVINQHVSRNLDKVTRTAMSNSKHSRQPDTSQMDSAPEVVNTLTKVPESNRLSGEIVTVRLNSISRRSLHPKLVPVPIPTVSDVQENPLNVRKVLRTSLVTAVNVKKDVGDDTVQALDKFSNKKEAFSSFRGELKVKNKDKHHRSKSAGEYSLGRVDKKYKKIYEIFPEDNHITSSTNTSGYSSAFEESINNLCSSSFKKNVSLSSSSIRNEDNFSICHTPKKKQGADSSPETKETFPKSPDMINQAGIVDRIIEESSETNSNKELIAHLLNEVSLQKVAQGL